MKMKQNEASLVVKFLDRENENLRKCLIRILFSKRCVLVIIGPIGFYFSYLKLKFIFL